MGRMDDYVEVHVRVNAFYEKYPDGSHQGSYEVVEVGGQTLIVYRSEVFRSPDDARPSVAFASEPFPGTTNFTRGSELMNAETSALGRAIANLGFETKKGMASAQEVRAAEERRKAPDPAKVADLTKQSKRKTLADLLVKHFNKDADAIGEFIKEETGKDKTSELSIEEMDKLIKEMAA